MSHALAPPAPAEWANLTEPQAWSHGAPLRLRYFFAKQDKDQLLTGVSYFNLAYLAVFAGFAFSIGPIQRKLVAEVDRNLTTIEDNYENMPNPYQGSKNHINIK